MASRKSGKKKTVASESDAEGSKGAKAPKKTAKKAATKKAAAKKAAKAAPKTAGTAAKKPAKKEGAKSKPEKAAKPTSKKASKAKAAKSEPRKAAKKSKKGKVESKSRAKATLASKAAPKRAERSPKNAKAPRPEREARSANADVADRVDGASSRRSRPKSSLPPGHELLDAGPLRGEPVDQATVIEAVRAAFRAGEEHPVRGREFLGVRSPITPPQDGEIDFARAVEAQKAAVDVLEKAAMVGEAQKAVDDRIAEVYAGEARDDE
jgi:hypothetical protein